MRTTEVRASDRGAGGRVVPLQSFVSHEIISDDQLSGRRTRMPEHAHILGVSSRDATHRVRADVAFQ